jgi:hypothetical protein
MFHVASFQIRGWMADMDGYQQKVGQLFCHANWLIRHVLDHRKDELGTASVPIPDSRPTGEIGSQAGTPACKLRRCPAPSWSMNCATGPLAPVEEFVTQLAQVRRTIRGARAL